MEENKNSEKASSNNRDKFKMDPPANAWNMLDAALERKQAMMYRQRGNRFKLLSIGLAVMLIAFISYYYIAPDRYSNSVKAVEKDNTGFVQNENRSVESKPSTGEVISEVGVSSGNAPVSRRGLGTLNAEHSSVVPRSSSASATQQHFSPKSESKDNTIVTAQNTNSDPPVAAPNPDFAAYDADREVTGGNSLNEEAENTSKIDTKCEDNATAPAVEKVAVESNVITAPAPKDENGKAEKKFFKGSDRTSIAAFYSPNYYSTNHLVDNMQSYYYPNPNDYSNREKSMYSFATGLNLIFDLTSHLSISSGAVYSTIAYSITLHTLYAGYGSDDQVHYQYPTSCGNIQMPDPANTVLHNGDSLKTSAGCTQVVKIISMPITTRYRIEKNRFTYFADAGFLANFIVQEKANMNIGNYQYEVINNIDGLKKENLGYMFGAGVQYNLNNGFGIFIEPTIRGSITSLTENTAFDCYPYSMGLNMGISFHF